MKQALETYKISKFDQMLLKRETGAHKKRHTTNTMRNSQQSPKLMGLGNMVFPLHAQNGHLSPLDFREDLQLPSIKRPYQIEPEFTTMDIITEINQMPFSEYEKMRLLRYSKTNVKPLSPPDRNVSKSQIEKQKIDKNLFSPLISHRVAYECSRNDFK